MNMTYIFHDSFLRIWILNKKMTNGYYQRLALVVISLRKTIYTTSTATFKSQQSIAGYKAVNWTVWKPLLRATGRRRRGWEMANMGRRWKWYSNESIGDAECAVAQAICHSAAIAFNPHRPLALCKDPTKDNHEFQEPYFNWFHA